MAGREKTERRKREAVTKEERDAQSVWPGGTPADLPLCPPGIHALSSVLTPVCD